MKKILVLFPKDWDRIELDAPRYRSRYRFFFEGFELFRFPDNARLLTFDVFRFIDRLVEKYRRIGIDGVVSNNEQFGTLIAAVVARRLGLPGADPLAIITAQHKYYSRMVQRQAVPEATPPFAVFPYEVRDPAELAIGFPCFVKPVKATFSVLARQVDDFAALQAHLRFRPLEKFLIKRLLKPFNDLLPVYADLPVDACNMIAEGLLEGEQVNVDGFVDRGRVTFLGMVDEVMYPGTHAFMRFEYPSRLGPDTQAKIRAVTERFLKALNYDHGFFNVEVVWQPETGAVSIIEINPRMASQLGNLYQRVDGADVYDILFSLATGESPVVPQRAGDFSTAASFVFRRFDGRAVERMPTAAQVRSALAPYPDARIMFYFKRGLGLAREMKWLGSHRYAVLNLGGASADDLRHRYEHIRRRLAFE